MMRTVEFAVSPGTLEAPASRQRRWFNGLLILAAALATLQLVWSLQAVHYRTELEYGESIIHDQASRILGGEPLYQDFTHTPFTVTAYTPVYYLAAAALQQRFGPGFLPGRLLSLTASLVATALVVWYTCRLGRALAPGLLAGVLLFGMGLGGATAPAGALINQLLNPSPSDLPIPIWGALYKEDALGLALSLAAMCFLGWRRSAQSAAAAGLLAGLALLTKQTYFAASIAGFVWLLQADRRLSLIFSAVETAMLIGATVVLQLDTGVFIQNVLLANMNPMTITALTYNLKALLLFQFGLLLAACIYVRRAGVLQQRRGMLGLLCLYWLLTMVPVLGMAKVGSNYNYWMEVSAPTASLAALGAWEAVRRPPAGLVLGLPAPIALVAASVLLVSVLVSPLLVRAAAPRISGADQTAEFDALVTRVRDEPHDVLASPLDVVTLARKPVVFEYAIFSIWYSQGMWDPRPLTDRVCNGDIGLMVIDHPVQDPFWDFQGYSSWPHPVLDAVRQAAVFDQRLAGRYVYRLTRGCPQPLGR